MTHHSIAFRHCTKRYGDLLAVDALSLEIRPGEITCLLGPNGAGKTTSLEILMGLRRPSSGDVLINGVSVSTAAVHAERRQMGYVSDEPPLYDFLTGREFVEFVFQLQTGRPVPSRLFEARLAELELSEFADRLMRSYSLGMRRKIALLAATLAEPPVLVLDEPTGALDAAGARVVKDMMITARDRGGIVLFSTHVMEIAERISDRLLIMQGGRLVADGSLDQLRSRANASPSVTLEDLFLRLTAGGRGSPAQAVGAR